MNKPKPPGPYHPPRRATEATILGCSATAAWVFVASWKYSNTVSRFAVATMVMQGALALLVMLAPESWRSAISLLFAHTAMWTLAVFMPPDMFFFLSVGVLMVGAFWVLIDMWRTPTK